MDHFPRCTLFHALFAIFWASLLSTCGYSAEYDRVVVRTGIKANPVEAKIVSLLVARLSEVSDLAVRVESETNTSELNSRELLVLVGSADRHVELRRRLQDHRIVFPDDHDPGPEGFVLKLLTTTVPHTLIVAGVDSRGCLYAVGELLRVAELEGSTLTIPHGIDIRSAPAFEIRGTQFGQSGVAKRLAHVRDWTAEETQRVILDYALAGANVFSTAPGPMYDFIKSYGLMTQGGFGANTGGDARHPEWNAFESIGRKGYVCLSIPAAREHMFRKCELQFRDGPTYDFVKFHGGDGGGCECDRCNPYGETFIRVVEQMAEIIHRDHPSTRVYFTNQKFDNEDDEAIFHYLNQKPREWLWAWGYGPGSDATTWQPGHRQTHRMDLFRYPGFGPYGLYPKEIIHQMPRRHVLVYYNELTHWKYAQHAYIQMYPRADRNGDLPPSWSHEIYERRPDQSLTLVYNRLTFYAWPRFYHRIFNDLLRYGVGDITHSSGHHDHFNQWMWQRLLWAPRTSVEDVVYEYCRTWFGRDAAPVMAEALYQLESNMEEQRGTPLADKSGIGRYDALVRQAGHLMSKLLMQENWLWRQHMQKASLDRYVQLDVRLQNDLQSRIEEHIAESLQSDDVNTAINESLTWIAGAIESEQMRQLRLEAGRLGDESNQLFGVRNDGFFNLKHDYVGLGWLKRQLERASAASADRKRELLTMIVDYENPGEGGWYDNLGTANRAPHVEFGYPYDHGQPYVAEMLSESNRPGQRSMHFTQDEDQGVTLRYRELNPESKYRIRFTLVRPWYQERYRMRMNQTSQSIYADEQLLVRDVELPEQMSDFFTYDVPQTATRDGDLTIRFVRSDDVARGDRVAVGQWRNSGGWGTLLSEAWLMKRD